MKLFFVILILYKTRIIFSIFVLRNVILRLKNFFYNNFENKEEGKNSKKDNRVIKKKKKKK